MKFALSYIALFLLPLGVPAAPPGKDSRNALQHGSLQVRGPLPYQDHGPQIRNEARQDLSDQIAENQKDIDVIEERLEELDDKIEGIRERLHEINQDKETAHLYQDEYDELAEDLDEALREDSDLRRQLETLEQDKEDLEDELRELGPWE